MSVTRIKNNQITDLAVNAASKLQDFSITSEKIANNLTYGSDLTVIGNLVVQGNVTSIETHDLVVEDPLILLAKDQVGAPGLDIGFVGVRGDEENIAFVWNEGDSRFATVFTSSELTNTVVAITSYASLQTHNLTAANAEFSGTMAVTGNVTVSNVNITSSSTFDVGNNQISNVADPSANSDAANKGYVDSVAASGFTIEDSTANTTVISGGDTLELLGTANEVAVLITNNDQVTVGLPSNVTIADSLSVTNDVSAVTGTYSGNVAVANLNADTAITAITVVASSNVEADIVNATTAVNTATVTASGNVTGGNLVSLADVTTVTVTATGNIDGANVNATTGVAATTVTATGNVNGDSVNAVTAVNTVTVNATGNVDADQVNAATAVNTVTVTATGNINGNNLISTNDVTTDTVTAAGNVDGLRFKSSNTDLLAPVPGNYTGERVTLLNFEDPAKTNYAIGVETSAIWHGVDTNLEDQGFKWYGNTVQVARLSGVGNLTLAGNLTADADIFGTNITAVANIVGGNILSDTVSTDSVTATGNIDGANVNAVTGVTAITVTASGDVNANNVVATNDISATTGTFSGNVSVGNIDVTGTATVDTLAVDNITATGNVDAANLNATLGVAATTVTATGNVDANIVNATTEINSVTVTATDNVTGGNLVSLADVTTVTVTATGNINGANVNADNLVTAVTVESTTVTATGNINADIVNATTTVNTVSVNSTGNVTGGNLISQADVTTVTVTATGNINGANVNAESGVTAATVSATTVTATGNINAANLNATLGVAATTVTASGNVDADIVNATTAINTATVTASGNVNANIVNANTVISTGNVEADIVNAATAVSTVTVTATGNVNGNNLVATADVTTVTVTATGNISAGNVNAVEFMTASTLVASGNLNANNATITNAVTAVSGVYTGNVDANNINATTSVTAIDMIASGNVNALNINAGDVYATDVNTDSIVGGNIVITAGDLDLALTGNIKMNQRFINELADPVQAFDAATKQYVDDAVSTGITIHPPVRVANPGASLDAAYVDGGTTATVTDTVAGNTVVFSTAIDPQVNDQLWFETSFQGILANIAYFVVSAPTTSSAVLSKTYDGVPINDITSSTGLTQAVRINSGQGATLTNTGVNAALVIDGVTLAANDRVLIYSQSTAYENGVYDVTVAGDASTAWVLTRSADMDTYIPDDINGMDAGDYFFVQEGTNSAGESYVMTAPIGPFVIGHDNLVFTQFSASSTFSAGDGLSLDGTIFSVNVDNDTTAVVGDNVVVKAGANLVTPNIGDATGNSLTLQGNGAISATSATFSGNVLAQNLNSNAAISGVSVIATGNVTGANVNAAQAVTATTVESTTVTATGNINADIVNATTAVNTATVVASGNVTGGNLVSLADVTTVTVTATGNINGANVNAESGVAAATMTASGNINADQVNAVTAVNTVTVTATGNVNGNNLVATADVTTVTVTATGNIDGANVNAATAVNTIDLNTTTVTAAGNVTGANVVAIAGVFADTATIVGNLDAGNISTAGTLSVDTIEATTVTATGNVTGGNLVSLADVTTVTVTATGNVTGNNLVAIDTVAATTGTFSGNVTANNLIALVNVGSDTITATGNIDSAANVNANNTTITNTLVAQGGLFTNALGAFALTVDTEIDTTTLVATDTVAANILSGNTIQTTGNVNANIVNANVVNATTTITATGNVTGGNLVSLSDVTTVTVTATGNVTGANVNAVTAVNTATVIATGNVTGGNLVSLADVSAVTGTFSGNVTAANLIVTESIAVDSIFAAGNITTAANINANNTTITNELVSNNIFASSTIGANSLSVATIIDTAKLVASGNVTADTLIGNTAQISGNISSANVNASVAVYSVDVVASGNISGENITAVDAVNADTVTATGNVTGNNLVALADVTTVTVTATGNVDADIVNAATAVSTVTVVATGNVDADIVNAATAVNTVTVTATGNVDADIVNAATAVNTVTVTATGNVDADIVNAATAVSTVTVTATGNVTGGNIVTAGTVSAAEVATANLTVTGQANLGNIVISGDNITGTNGVVTFNAAGEDVDFKVSGDTNASVLVVDASSDSVIVGSSTPTAGATLKIDSTDSLMLPVGNTTQRPDTPVDGMFRFNTSEDLIEVYNSAGWQSIGSAIAAVIADQFTGDGSTVAFTLTAESTTAGTIVSINGVVQIPVTAYAVSGTTLTFSEAPDSTDTIDARVVTTDLVSITSLQNAPANAIISGNLVASQFDVTGNLIPSANVTFDLGSAANRWNDLYLAGDSIILGDLVIKNTGGNTIGFFGPDGTTPGTIDSNNIDSAAISNGTSNVAVATAGGNVNVNIDGNLVTEFGAAGVAVPGKIFLGNVILKEIGGNLRVRNASDSADAVVEATFVATSISTGNLQLGGNHIESIDINGEINLLPNGTGNIELESSTIQLGKPDTDVQVTSHGTGNLVFAVAAANVISVTATGIDARTTNIVNMANPVNAQDAATKQYVDEVAEGLATKPAVELATTANLTATYDNGASGVGATLTGTTNGAFPTIDGITLTSTEIGFNGVLVKNQTNKAHNGRYNLTTVGNGSTPFVLTRCGLCDEASEIPGAFVFVKAGTINGGSGFVQVVADPATFVVGVDDINVFQFSGAGTFSAGAGLTLSENTFSITVATPINVVGITNAGANGVGNIGAAGSTFNTVFAKATSAQYADLAEMYSADAEYAPGTVLSFGGAHEVTISSTANDTRVAGVVSTNPSYLMNSTQTGEHVAAVALTGRVPTRVYGPVAKGDMMVSAGNGYACASASPAMGTVIGKALEDFDQVQGTIEIVVGRL